jgi:26S proteasome regulatory subunit N8
MYVSGLIRSILSLHDLINNKINSKEIELERTKREKEEEKLKEDEAKKKLEEKNAA